MSQDFFKLACQQLLAESFFRKSADLTPEQVRMITGAFTGGVAGSLLPSKSILGRAAKALTGAGLGAAAGYNMPQIQEAFKETYPRGARTEYYQP
jgi:uncharacterized protein YcfJ